MRHGRAARRTAVCLLAGLFCIAQAATASACALDQLPSISANGQLARTNPVAPTTQAQLATWTYFIFPGEFPARRPIVLTEDRREVARTLMPSALRQPWGWVFGDGQSGQGWTVRHTYARPGRWRVQVYAYNPESKSWNLFDQVTIVTRG